MHDVTQNSTNNLLYLFHSTACNIQKTNNSWNKIKYVSKIVELQLKFNKLLWFCWVSLFMFAAFFLVVGCCPVGCQYHSQVIGWKDPYKETSNMLREFSPQRLRWEDVFVTFLYFGDIALFKTCNAISFLSVGLIWPVRVENTTKSTSRLYLVVSSSLLTTKMNTCLVVILLSDSSPKWSVV